MEAVRRAEAVERYAPALDDVRCDLQVVKRVVRDERDELFSREARGAYKVRDEDRDCDADY